jgi:hypothetical protein
MKIYKSLLAFLSKEHKEETPEGLCPNCWGREEYGGKFYEAVKNNKTDINSTNPNVGWIQDYADKHLSGIQLKPTEEGMVCSKCKVTYKPSE